MSDTLKKLREPAALAAVGYAGLVLLAAVINLLVPPSYHGLSQSFANRAYDQAPVFLNFTVALAIGVAVYLANDFEPPLARARLVTLLAVIESGVAALFGVVTALALFGADPAGQSKLAQFFVALGGAAVVAVAGWYAWLTWQRHSAPKPQQERAAGWPGAGVSGPGYPQQPAPPPGGFGWAPQQQPPYPGQPQPGQPGPPQSFGSDRTQMLPPVPGGGAPIGQPNPQIPAQAQPMVPPTMQDYAPQPQPWSPGVGGGQQIPPQAPPQPENEQHSNSGGFPIGDWRSE
jgi:hypothetical protein